MFAHGSDEPDEPDESDESDFAGAAVVVNGLVDAAVLVIGSHPWHVLLHPTAKVPPAMSQKFDVKAN